MARYSIKDLEKISGIKAHTIRMWERRYGLIEPERTPTNIRYYSDCDLKRLLNISILNHHGIKISHIAGLSDTEIRSRVLDLSLDGRTNNVQIESLMVSMLELDEKKFLNTLSASVIKFGFESTVENILFPFLEKVGVLWQAGTISPAEEHFMSNLIRQKLFVAIDHEMQNSSVSGPRIIMFLPEGELHEIGLLFYNLLARKEGLDVIYLGPSVPVSDLLQVHHVRPADAFMTSFISAYTTEGLEDLMKLYREKFPEIPFLVSGYQIKELNPSLPDGFTVIPGVKGFKDAIKLVKFSE
ncbi:MerR family transcriptional regulator [Natronoflexus pectinivorans]|uniref:DNA-binding transcriptional MerR regulator n=1 Tax=Natronoflexus pectinivorans TaxID=682526 RepID=A0A4V2RVB7_9BACT|nr:MerR family transcriptional regulator [Natronoflexus pectinivorans]TCO03634.1 DNA-binding transcriptional MerR regulator [Natronoflexus pectinivorans]